MKISEYLPLAKYAFRELRKGKDVTVKDFAALMNLSWPTTRVFVDELIKIGYLVENPITKFVRLNPHLKSKNFVGIYISKKSIEISTINFFGKEIDYEKLLLNENSNIWDILKEKITSLKEIGAIAITSDDMLIQSNGDVTIPGIIFLSTLLKEQIKNEDIKLFFVKTNETTTIKCFEDYELNKEDLNIVMYFHERNYYYTISKNDEILRAIKGVGQIDLYEELFEKSIKPICNSINPDNFIIISSSKEEFQIALTAQYDWLSKMLQLDNMQTNIYEGRGFTKIIVNSYFKPSESAGLYALYKYFEW